LFSIFTFFYFAFVELLLMNVALVAYPLSEKYRSEFEAGIGGSLEYWKLGEMRRLPWRKLLTQLRASNLDSLYLPIEDPDSLALAPLLKLIAAVSRAKRLILVSPELVCRPFRRLQAVFGLAGLVWASFHGQYSLWRSYCLMRSLLKQPLSRVAFGKSGRIFYLKPNLWYGVKAGGSVGHVAGVVNEFLRQGYEIDLVASEMPELVSAERIGFRRITPLRYYGLPPEINLYRFSRQLQRQVRGMIAEHGLKPDFVYQRLSTADASGAILTREFKIPLVLEYNGSEVWAFDNWGTSLIYRETALQAETLSLLSAQLIVVVSEALRDELLARGIPGEKIVAYPNGIDPARFDPERFSQEERADLRNKYGLGADAVVATFIGTFGAWHGIEILAQAIRRMVDEDEPWLAEKRLRFLLVGDGLKMPLVREILAGPKYQPYYTLTGLIPQDQAPLYLAASDVLLSPHVANRDGSRFFGSPTKLFEYMAMGKGIVASDLEQIGQILKNSLRAAYLPKQPPQPGQPELAVLGQPGAVGDLISGIRFLTENPGWRDCLGKNAQKEALAKYTWERHVLAIQDRLQQIERDGRD
jgi:glycosyltransferase involved in cell wall biosynthesis